MDISRDLLINLIRQEAGSPLERVALSTALVGADWLIDEFVDEARAEGLPWALLAEAMGPGASAGSTGLVQRPDGGDIRTAAPHSSAKPTHDGKYRALWQHLTESNEQRLAMTFNDIERLLGFPLPPSSREHQPHWYGYKGSAVARAVIDAGWKAQNVDLAGEHVTFVRVAS